MVDLVVTPANVVTGADASVTHGFAGETLLAGQAVYMDPTTRKWLKADNNSAAPGAKVAGGIALNGGSINQAVAILTSGPITIGAAMTLGTPYFLGDTPGGICPEADIAAGESVCQIGLALSTSVLNVNIVAPGISR